MDREERDLARANWEGKVQEGLDTIRDRILQSDARGQVHHEEVMKTIKELIDPVEKRVRVLEDKENRRDGRSSTISGVTAFLTSLLFLVVGHYLNK